MQIDKIYGINIWCKDNQCISVINVLFTFEDNQSLKCWKLILYKRESKSLFYNDRDQIPEGKGLSQATTYKE